MRISLIVPMVCAITALFTVSPAMAAPADCAVTWGSLPKSSAGMSPGSIIGIRAGEHPCYDRLVFDTVDQGVVPGWDVRYVNRVTSDPASVPIKLRGGAQLLIVLRVNGHDISTGRSSFRYLPSISGFRTFKDLKAVGDFEGLASVGLGVRARLPFRVFRLPGINPGTSRIVVDVANYWR
jgi:hypothetical protein